MDAFDLIEHDAEDMRDRSFLAHKAAQAQLLLQYQGWHPVQ
jgi:hypothetical protein